MCSIVEYTSDHCELLYQPTIPLSLPLPSLPPPGPPPTVIPSTLHQTRLPLCLDPFSVDWTHHANFHCPPPSLGNMNINHYVDQHWSVSWLYWPHRQCVVSAHLGWPVAWPISCVAVKVDRPRSGRAVAWECVNSRCCLSDQCFGGCHVSWINAQIFTEDITVCRSSQQHSINSIFYYSKTCMQITEKCLVYCKVWGF